MTAALILFGVSAAVAQSAVTGKIVDETGAPLIGASVTVPGTSQGVSTDVDGNFTLKTDAKEIEISYVGYVPTKKPVTGPNARLGIIQMEPDAVALQDVIVMQSVAVQRKTPVAVSTVNAEEISYKLGGQEFPEILKSTPGVYVTKDGGGFGDSKINMRGFQAANVAVMVNGVPVNDMEWGGVYWSNWAGLSDVTRSMQTQRGLGASKISSPSVGGSVNIVTNGIEAKQGGTFSFGVGNDGLYSLSFSLSTGLTKSGWALSVLGAKRWGDGYIQGTNFEGYNWFVNISKRINDRHQLSLTAFGAPQKHAQRHALDDGLKIEEWQKAKNFMGEKDMYRYNAEYGFDKNGRQRYSHFNEYHKPQISLNHQWQIDYKSSLSTALYMSIGRGSGYSGQGRTSADRNMWKGTNYGVLNTTFRNPDGTFAYDKIQEMNAASPDGSRMIMSKSNNNHMWYGLLSTYTNQISKSLELSAGIDVRYYIGEHNNEIIDLYDGKYFIDDSSRANVKPEQNAAAADPNWVYEKLQVGDKVYRDYDGHVHQEGVFAQLEWTKKKPQRLRIGFGFQHRLLALRPLLLRRRTRRVRARELHRLHGQGRCQLQHQRETQRIRQPGLHQPRPVLLGRRIPAEHHEQRQEPRPAERKGILCRDRLRIPLGHPFGQPERLLHALDGQVGRTFQLDGQRRLRPREPLGCRRTPHGPRTGFRPAPQPLAGRDRYAFAGRLAVGQRLEGLHLRHAGAAPDQGFGRHGRLGHHG